MEDKLSLVRASVGDDKREYEVPRMTFSASKVNRVVREIVKGDTAAATVRRRWLSAVATRVSVARPDIASALTEVLGVKPLGEDHLVGLTIGEVGVCYEAVLSGLDRDSRKSAGQFFTPDDAANFMALQSLRFGPGVWLDPCCGVGNLAWHLARVQADPSSFVSSALILIDRDETALKTAIALIAADFIEYGSESGVRALAMKSKPRDFLNRTALPDHDFTIVNPPYARAEARTGYATASCRDLFAYFMERVAKSSSGYIAVTPASYLSAPKFAALRAVLDREHSGGRVYVFDNVPDTLFRGYKYGSNNTSKTNFVRAAITVCSPAETEWRTTPILRWQSSDRARMFESCSSWLTPRRYGPHGEWAKIAPSVDALWSLLAAENQTLDDLVTQDQTEYQLHVGLTPRYFISATFRELKRGSRATLYFRNADDRDRAALVLNSSVPYLWWRALDGGVTLPRRVLLSVPIPASIRRDSALIERLHASEAANLVVKLNAGRENENVKHPKELVEALNKLVIPGTHDLSPIYTNSMFPPAQ